MIARRQAKFCIATGLAPSEYQQLTRLEREAFWDVIEEIHARRKR